MAVEQNPETALSDDQIAQFKEDGYLHVEGVLNTEEVKKMQVVTEDLLTTYSVSTGEDFFENAFDDEETVNREKLVDADLKVLYHLEGYSTIFKDLIFDERLVTPMTQLIGSNVEFHQSSLHAKPPEKGAPFPMHQDSQFFHHETYNYVDALIHINDAPSKRGPLQFIPGSHKEGPLPHVYDQGEKFLPPEEYPFEDAVELPAAAGDIILFHINAIHGSGINRSNEFRPIIRMGYRDPVSHQTTGIGIDKVPLLVAGERNTDRCVPGDY
jgi:phytanoyl-CoA hydroxylase